MRATMLLLSMLALPLPGLAGSDSDLVRKASAHSVQETTDRLEALVKEKGMTVFARVDHKANAASIGKEMPDSQLLIFGAPAAGTLIMLKDPAAGVDLPLRVLTYADADGKVWLTYHNPKGLKTTHDLGDLPVLGKVAGALDGMTNQVIK